MRWQRAHKSSLGFFFGAGLPVRRAAALALRFFDVPADDGFYWQLFASRN
jgi:hypothetical protein